MTAASSPPQVPLPPSPPPSLVCARSPACPHRCLAAKPGTAMKTQERDTARGWRTEKAKGEQETRDSVEGRGGNKEGKGGEAERRLTDSVTTPSPSPAPTSQLNPTHPRTSSAPRRAPPPPPPPASSSPVVGLHARRDNRVKARDGDDDCTAPHSTNRTRKQKTRRGGRRQHG